MSWLPNFETPARSEGAEVAETTEATNAGGFELSELETDYLRQIEGLQPEQWSELSTDARLESLRELEWRLADIEGRPPVELRCETIGPGQYGYFDRQSNVMVLNEAMVRAESPLDAIDTVAHEGRHAYQHFCVLHPGTHDDQFEVAAWEENFETYLDAKLYGYEAYRDQPVEADAWAFGEAIRGIFERT